MKDSAQPAARGTRPGLHPKRLGFFALVWVPYAALVVRFWWLCDDAYISFRYARNWADGVGVRFNLGEHSPVEGYSNFLWVALGAFVERLGGSQEFLLPCISFALGSFTLWRVYRIAQQSFGAPPVCAALGSLTLALSPAFTVWSTGGLETMAFACLFLLTFEHLVLRPGVACGGLYGLGLALIRVEGVAWVLILALIGGLVQRLEGRSLRPVVAAAATALTGFAIYYAWRYAYYGLPLANTAYVKAGFGSAALVLGRDYVIGFALATLTPLLLPGMGLVALRQGNKARIGAVLVVALGVYAYALLVGGDYMPVGRMLLPSLPLQALLCAVALAQLSKTRVPIGIVLAGLGLPCAFNGHIFPKATREVFDVRLNADEFRSEIEQWRYMVDNTRERKEIARVLAAHTRLGESLVRPAIGVIGFDTDLFIYDTYGLVTRTVAMRAGRANERSPGHAKRVEPTFFLPLSPTYLAVRRIAIESVGSAERRLRRAARHWKDLYGEEASAAYVPQAYRVPESAELAYVLVLRQVAENENAQAVWKAFPPTLEK